MKKYLVAGAVVMTTAGRDKQELYLILNDDGEFVNLVNGTSRTIENPKKKNKKHLHLLCKSETTSLNMNELSNAQVNNFLSNYNKSRVK